jgi:hypothetical protein
MRPAMHQAQTSSTGRHIAHPSRLPRVSVAPTAARLQAQRSGLRTFADNRLPSSTHTHTHTHTHEPDAHGCAGVPACAGYQVANLKSLATDLCATLHVRCVQFRVQVQALGHRRGWWMETEIGVAAEGPVYDDGAHEINYPLQH